MKKFISIKIFLIGFVLVVFFTPVKINSQTIHFEFANPQITGTAPNQFYEFDIMAHSTSSTQFKVAQLYLAYNTAGFGTNIVLNNTITITKGPLLNNIIGPNNDIGQYILSRVDNTSSIVSIQNSWRRVVDSGLDQGYELTNALSSSPAVYVHVRIAISNPNQTSGISFVNTSISQGNLQHYYFTTPGTSNKSTFSSVIYGNPLNEPLPVELSSFTASVTKKGIELKWTTETEINNFGFEIESAAINGIGQNSNPEFSKIAFVPGQGNSNSPKNYSYNVTGIKYGNYAFRLKQIDTDGQFEYGNVIEVKAGEIPNGFILEQNYPNPFNPTTTIRFASSSNQLTKLVVYDIIGNQVAELFNGETESNRVYDIDFDATSLASGVYIYSIRSGSFTQTHKMLLMK